MQYIIKIEMFLYRSCYVVMYNIYSMTTIGVPTSSMIAAAGVAQSQKTTLEILLQVQKSLDEFKIKILEMEEEMQTVKIENRLLKTKINELTSKESSPPRRGFFGYGAGEF